MSGSRKLSISLTESAAEHVTAFARDNSISVSEVIRRALAIQRFIIREVESGKNILTRSADGTTERIQFVWPDTCRTSTERDPT